MAIFMQAQEFIAGTRGTLGSILAGQHRITDTERIMDLIESFEGLEINLKGPAIIHHYRTSVVHAPPLEARIEHLIELAKTTSFEWRRQLTEQDLHGFISETLRSLSEYASFRGFSVQTENALPNPCPVRFDGDMLRRVFENLISNALSYGDPGSPIRVTARPDPSRELLEIAVENRGTPISPEQAPLVFEPYFRGDTRKNKSGFGLGLASVKSIVESHGWVIDLRSTPDGETTFRIRIPRTDNRPWDKIF